MIRSEKLTLRHRGLVAGLGLGALVGVAHDSLAQSPAVVSIYKEPFGFCTQSTGAPAAQQAGWQALKIGSALGKPQYLKVFTNGSPNTSGAINSNPIGFNPGYAFWLRPVYGLTIFTKEYSFDLQQLQGVSYEQRLSGVNGSLTPNGTRLALLVKSGDETRWYFSKTLVRQTGKPGVAWNLVSFDPWAENYGTLPYDPILGPKIPSSFNETLPSSGTVLGFGVFLDEVNGRVRIDNFSISGWQEPAPGEQVPDGTKCPIGSPDYLSSGTPPTPAPAGSTPTPTPTVGGSTDDSGDDSSSSVDQQIPDEPRPPELSAPTPTAAATPTVASTSTATPRATATPSATETPAPVSTPAGTPTGTPNVTPTQPPTSSPTATPVPASSATPEPTPQVTTQAVYSFCPSSEEGRGRKMKATRRAQQRLLRVHKFPSATEIRDTAVLGVLLTRKVPVGALVNLTINSYASTSGELTLYPATSAQPRRIRLGRGVRALLDRYIQQVRIGGAQAAPLFTATDAQLGILSDKQAACLKELTTMIKRRIRKNRLASEVAWLRR